jgi:hypothetical protein
MMLELTPEEFEAIRMLSRAPSFRGPANSNAYIIARERMEVLREVIARSEKTKEG